MDETNRAGRYRVARRVHGTGLHAGRVYEAYNEDTGAPAVVVTPGSAGDWRPSGDWAVTVTARATPPQVTLEATEPLSAEALEELPELLTRAVVAAADLGRRPDGQEHLVGERARRSRTLADLRAGRTFRTVLAAASVCALAAVAGVLAGTVARRPSEVVGTLEASRAAPTAWLDTASQLMAPVPAKPFEGQKKPPCTPRVEEEVAGACWGVLEARAPCPAEAYERAGKCYLPTRAAPKPGQSMDP